MFHSLRIRLLIWQFLLLAAVLFSFGSVIFLQWRTNLLSELDKELSSSAAVLEGTLRGVSLRKLGPRDRRPEPPAPIPGKPKGPPPDQRRPRQPPGSPPRGDAAAPDILAGDVEADLFALPHQLVMNQPARKSTYFAIFDVNDQIIASSEDREFRVPRLMPGQRFIDVGPYREVELTGPGRTRILVGREVADFNRQSASFLWWLSLMGLGILSVGCLAGYWLTGRAIAPIREVSQTVQAISGTSLESRIDTSEMDTEFIQLSVLVNEMLDRLQSTIEQQKNFIADASHELRTPVSVIGMHAELALASERTAEEYRKTLETCLRASNRLKGLTEGLLTLARSDADQLSTCRERVDLGEMAHASIRFLQPLADQHHVRLDCHCRSTAPVTGDPQLLRQLMDNLIANAVVHNRRGGQATVSVEAEANQVRLRVRDNGPGIDSADLPHLFDRFYRVDKSRSRQAGGSGLGLAICQSIARSQGGQLQVTSQLNEGTTIECVLPWAAAESE